MSNLASFQNQVKPNWCPGCGDYAVQMALQQAAVKLNLEPHQLALVSGIGCSGRIGGYLYAYGMHTTHGRALPFAQGVKLANPELTVIACGGDGDGFAIGTAHTIHAMRRNVNITYILMDNHVYGLTKGQTSPRSDVGFKTKTTPTGNIETPIAALELALASGATFVAQGFSAQLPQLVDLIVAAVRHEGFSFVNVFSPCVTFNHTNTYEWFREHLSDVKDIAGYDPHDKGAAARHIMEKEGMLTGLLYENDRASYEQASGLAGFNTIKNVEKCRRQTLTNCWKVLSKNKISKIKNTTQRVVFFINSTLKHIQKQGNNKGIDKINEQTADQRYDKISFRRRSVTCNDSIHISHGIRCGTHTEAAAGSGNNSGLIIAPH